MPKRNDSRRLQLNLDDTDISNIFHADETIRYLRNIDMKSLTLRSISCLLYFLLVPIIGVHFNPAYAKEEIDPSDPTKIYTYAGGGVKYTDYTNGESMIEVRATGNVAASDSDMVMFELGYGWHDGDLVPGDNSDFTNGRVRWFHLFPMDYSIVTGYRGWATQIDVQLAGPLRARTDRIRFQLARCRPLD
jgi:hypothetical protein